MKIGDQVKVNLPGFRGSILTIKEIGWCESLVKGSNGQWHVMNKYIESVSDREVREDKVVKLLGDILDELRKSKK